MVEISRKVKVKFYCGYYKGEPKWKASVFGPICEEDECTASDIIEVDIEEWLHDEVHIKCPECGSDLHQIDDHFELETKENNVFKNDGDI